MNASVAKDMRPVPDPTVLTTEALQREIAALKELIFTRLGGMDKAIELQREISSRIPSETSVQVGHLKELVMMKFGERDLRNAQNSVDAKEAMVTARQAASTAIGKAEESLNKRLDVSESARALSEERWRMMMPRSESEALHKAHAERIGSMLQRLDATDDRGRGAGHSWTVIIAVVSGMASIGSMIFIAAKLSGTGG